MKNASSGLPIEVGLFRPGMKVAVACSGGADSVALLRRLLEEKQALGLALSVAHMNHGIRGAEADRDQAFVESLARNYDLPIHIRAVDTPGAADSQHQGLEEAARSLRYHWFWELLSNGHAEAVVTAHTLDDQAETVLHRLIRGAWTEGLGGIFPVLEPDRRKFSTDSSTVRILRPFLSATRSDIESWLQTIGQPWREDSTNRDTAYTRNRLRHELIPSLTGYNPKIKHQLSNLAAIARDEDGYWQTELERLLPSLLLPGKAVRGGGRATGTLDGGESLSIEIERLRLLHPALRRRVLRAAVARLGTSLDFEDTEQVLALSGFAGSSADRSPRPGLRLEMTGGLRAERTPRELRLFRAAPHAQASPTQPAGGEEYMLPIPGSVEASAFGLRLEAAIGHASSTPLPEALLRGSRPGDRVVLRHSRSRLKISEALRRARQPAASPCPVLEWQGEIVWILGVPIESAKAREAVLTITSQPVGSS